MNIEIAKTRHLADAALQSGIDNLLAELQQHRWNNLESVPDMIHIDDEHYRQAMKFTVRDKGLSRLLQAGLEKLGYWLDRQYDSRDRDIYYRYPRNATATHFKEGGTVMEPGESLFPAEMFRDNYQRLQFSEFVGSQSERTAELHQGIIAAIEGNIKIYPDTGLLALEEAIAGKAGYALPDADFREVEVLRKPGSSIFRITIHHKLGQFDAFFVLVEGE